MRVKYISQKKDSHNGYLAINRVYSVVRIEVYCGSDPDERKIQFVCIDKSVFDSSVNKDPLYSFRFYPTPKESFEILSYILPDNWTFYFLHDTLLIEPKIFKDYWEDFYNDESLDVFKKEALHIIAFDSQKDMRGLFAQELIDHIAEKGYDPAELSEWSKTYELDLLEMMYDQKPHKDVLEMLTDLSLFDWNPELAIPEKELIAKLTRWCEEGAIK